MKNKNAPAGQPASAATPSSGPPTPTPDTPITPQHPSSFNNGLNNLNKGPAFTSNGPNQPNASQPGQQPGVQSGAQVGSQPVSQPDGQFSLADDVSQICYLKLGSQSNFRAARVWHEL
jgi:hypothetical protein